MAGKMLLRIKGKGSDSPYAQGRNPIIRFAMVSRPEAGVRKQATNFYTCRDFINEVLRARVHVIEDDYKYSPEVDLTKLRLLIGRDCRNREDRYTFKERLFSAKRLLNLYENIAGFDKPSKIATVRLEGGTAKNAWLLTGPVEWLRYSQLTSMVTLLFRVISNYGPIEFATIDEVEEWFENLIAEYREDEASGIYEQDLDLDTYLPASYQKFYMMMKYFDEIFTEPMTGAYPETGCVHSSGGIYQLCCFATGQKTLNKRMKETWKKYEKERQERVRTRIEKKFEVARGAPSL